MVAVCKQFLDHMADAWYVGPYHSYYDVINATIFAEILLFAQSIIVLNTEH